MKEERVIKEPQDKQLSKGIVSIYVKLYCHPYNICCII